MDLQKVLVLSPHTDDGELGAGGTIARFLDEGKEVYYVVFSSCGASIPQDSPSDILRKECLQSTKILGISPEQLFLLDYDVRTFPDHRQEILENMIVFKERFKPDLVLVPSSHDMHQDHGTIHHEALRAFKKETSIWGYEHPWNNLTFTTDIFVRLKQEHMGKKIAALKQYESQNNRSYFDETYLRSLAYTRAVQVDLDCVEAFELIRLLV